jgi:hypothetical protein
MRDSDGAEGVYAPPLPGAPIELYLSDGALEAAQAAFPPVPVAAKRQSDQLPARSALRIGEFRGDPGAS